MRQFSRIPLAFGLLMFQLGEILCPQRKSNLCTTYFPKIREEHRPCKDLVQMSFRGFYINVAESGFSVNNQSMDFIREMISKNNSLLCVFNKKEYSKNEVCCEGYKGVNCDKAVRFPESLNNTICKSLGFCSSPCGFFWHCDENLDLVTFDEKFCYVGNSCLGEKSPYAKGKMVTRQNCCLNGHGGSWGTIADTCWVCLPVLGNDTMELKEKANFGCRSYGAHLIRTFNGSFIKFKGACRYIMSEYKNLWSVHLDFTNCSSILQCRKALYFKFGEIMVHVENNMAAVNMKPVDMDKGLTIGGVVVMKRYDYISIETQFPKVQILLDGDSYVDINLDTQLMTLTGLQGVCGNLDSDVKHGVVSENGFKNPADFMNSYVVPGKKCITKSFTSYPILAESIKHQCHMLKSFPFDACNKKVDPSWWIDLCDLETYLMKNMIKDISCAVFESYTLECLKIAISCIKGFHFGTCVSLCPVTCETMHMATRLQDCNYKCMPSCYCPPGTYLDGWNCVPIEQCSCKHNQKWYRSGSRVKMDCNNCICKNAVWQCEKNQCPVFCTLLGQSNLKMFNGEIFIFKPSACAYSLVDATATTLEKLNILATFNKCTAVTHDGINCLSTLMIKGKDFIVHISPGSIRVNGHYYNALPYYGLSVIVKMVTSSYLLVEGNAFRILYSENKQLYIKLSRTHFHKVQGLCGNSDHVPNNNVYSMSRADFLIAFKDPFCSKPMITQVENSPYTLYLMNKKQAIDVCRIIQDGYLFSDCYEVVSYQPFYHLCMKEMYLATSLEMGPMCVAVEAYARDCALHGVFVNWKLNKTLSKLCPFSCSSFGGGVYNVCGSVCKNYCRDLMTVSDLCVDECVSGCQCSPGQLLNSSNHCVPVDKCDCFEKTRRRYFPAGMVTKTDYRTCICHRGLWNCTENHHKVKVICPKNQIYRTNLTECELTCESLAKKIPCFSETYYESCGCPHELVMGPNGTCMKPVKCPCRYGDRWLLNGAILRIGCKEFVCTADGIWKQNRDTKICPTNCWTSGDQHYKTFDERHYTFVGDCVYVLSRSRDNTFSIITSSMKCGKNGLNCAKKVFIKLKENVIRLKMGSLLDINGIKIRNFNYKGPGLDIFTTDLFLNIFSSLGVIVQWDFGNRLYIHLSAQWKGKVQGLCGNFDENSNNDFLTTANSMERLPSMFAKTWQLFDCPLPPQDEQHLCEEKKYKLLWATEKCKLIKFAGVFQRCREALPDYVVQNFYDNCLSDACRCDAIGNCDCLCEAIANFAMECTFMGFPSRWRHQGQCPMQCSGGAMYLQCSKLKMETCKDLPLKYPSMTNDQNICIEGCFCLPGYLREGEKCILPESCPCYVGTSVYAPGTIVITGHCTNCTCIDGVLQCKNICVCPEGNFQCSDGSCIDAALVCDMLVDCADGEDESKDICRTTTEILNAAGLVTTQCSGSANQTIKSTEAFTGSTASPLLGRGTVAETEIPYLWDTANTSTSTECVFSMCAFWKEFGFEGPSIVGWTEKDGLEGPTSEQEIVYMNDEVSTGDSVHVSCMTCTCLNGTLSCDKKTCDGCTYSLWSEWTPCSKSCGNGFHERKRTVHNNGSQSCALPVLDIKDCNSEMCKEIPVWSLWSSWSNCGSRLPCATSFRTRRRFCTNNRTVCFGNFVQTEPCIVYSAACNMTGADRKDLCRNGMVWSECANRCPLTCMHYTAPATCIQSGTCYPGCRCPNGTLELLQQCIPLKNCPCYDEQEKMVFQDLPAHAFHPCKHCKCTSGKMVCHEKPNCYEWSEWTSWGRCSQTCGTGDQYRYRYLLNGSSANCWSHKEQQTQACSVGDCPAHCVIEGATYQHNDKTRETLCRVCYCRHFGEVCQAHPLASVNGSWSAWSRWSSCTSSCGGGVTYRTRSCSAPSPRCAGDPCPGAAIEERWCNENVPCCEVSEWASWSSCECQGNAGMRKRWRIPLNRNKTAEATCGSTLERTIQCPSGVCQRSCPLTSWLEWPECTASCGGGIQHRKMAGSLSPQFCNVLFQERFCNLDNCPCGPREQWAYHAVCENTCRNRYSNVLHDSFCQKRKSLCVCAPSFYRNQNGTCVEASQCNDRCYVGDQPGEIWNTSDGCHVCQCIANREVCHHICPPPTCKQGQELVYEGPSPCCPRCREKKGHTCQLMKKWEYLKNQGTQCESLTKVRLTYCTGSCGSSRMVPLATSGRNSTHMDTVCRCCAGRIATLKPVTVSCGPHKRRRKMYYAELCDCRCKQCD